MTPAQAHNLFLRLRGQFEAHDPALRTLTLKLRRKHFLPHPKARDLAWYDERDGTVNLMVQALGGPDGRVEGLLAHELGHALDVDASRSYAERRADRLAKQVLGLPVRYDDEDVQNTLRGVAPRPARLPENREVKMRNPNDYTKAAYPYEVFYQRQVGKRVVTGSVPVASKAEADDCVRGMKRSPDVIEAFVRKRNPARGYKMPEAQARHTAEGLRQRMVEDGADTYKKKVKWVQKHIPSIDDPVSFVGWVTKGERGRVVRNPAAHVVRVTVLDSEGRNVGANHAYFEKAGPFVRSQALRKTETPETVKDNATKITHVPTGLAIFSAEAFVAHDNHKELAVAAMRALRQWLKTLSKDEVDTISTGFNFGSRSMSAEQERLLREANRICLPGRRKANPARGSTPSLQKQIASLDRRIELAEEAGVAPHALIEKRDQLAARRRSRRKA